MNPRVLFVVSNLWGSAMHRGYEMAHLLNASVCQCASCNASAFDTVVHVKFPCWRLRHASRDHIFDRVDNYEFDMADVPWIRTEIVPTHHMANACTHRCVVIPHHMNLNCSIHPRPWRRIRENPVIGIVGTDVRSTTNMVRLSLLDYSVRYEHMGHPCDFFDAIDVAVVWKKHSGVDIPTERFTNPIWFNIPAIAHSFHVGYTEYVHAYPFVCASLWSLRQRVRDVIRADDSIVRSFSLLRREVTNDVATEHVVSRYRRLLATVSDATTNHTWDASTTVSVPRSERFADARGGLALNPGGGTL
jgi:hypothetical protein